MARQLKLLLESPQLHVGRTHIGEQRYQHVVIALDGGVEIIVGRLNGTAIAAPEVQLPGQIEAPLPVAEPLGCKAGKGVGYFVLCLLRV